jgi:pentatricopeptide repeat protein
MDSPIDEVQQYIDNHQFEEAENKAREQLKDSPDNIEHKTVLARVLAIREKFDEAIQILDDIIKEDDKNYHPVYLLALIKEHQENYEEAINLYYQAIQLNPNNGKLYYQLGAIYNNYKYKGKNEQSALRNLRKAITSNDPPPDAFLELASLEPFSRAVNILQNGISKYPSDDELRISLCEKFYFLEEYLKCIETIDIAMSQGVAPDNLLELKALAFYRNKNYQEAIKAVNELCLAVELDDRTKINISAFEGLLLCETEEYIKAEKILEKAIAEDVSNYLDFAGHFILICCHLRNSKVEKAEKVFREIPVGSSFMTTFTIQVYRYLEVDSYYLEALDGLISKGDSSQKKAKYFRAIYSYSSRFNGEELSVDTLEQIRNHFLDAIELLGPRNSDIYESLYFVSTDLQKWADAAYYYFLSQVYEENDAYTTEIESAVLDASNKNQKSIERLLSVIDKVVGEPLYLIDKFAKRCLSQLIAFFHSKEKFDMVVRLADKFSYRNIVDAGRVFEVAYAYGQINNKKQAKSYYQAYLHDVGEDFAVANNLALLEEEASNLAEAEKLFQLAMHLDPTNEKVKNNHDRIITRIQKEEGQRRAYQQAVDLYQQELEQIRLLAVKLYSIKTDDDLIFYSNEKMASITGLEFSEIEIRVDEFIKKKYFEEITSDSLQFNGRLLRPNSVLVPVLQSDLKKFEEKDAIKAIMNDLLSESLDTKYGYNQVLLESLSAIKSKELSTMLERDLYETVVSLAIKSYKSALILCGSIAEAVLLDNLLSQKEAAIQALERIMSKENKKLKSEDKRLERWGLDRLLDVALEAKIISENLYHWGHGIRGFRNLVHPGVEQRKSIEVSRENAEMAWNVIKRLLIEIKASDNPLSQSEPQNKGG